MKRLWGCALPVFLAAAVYQNIFRGWFLMDDFAWLGLPLDVQKPADFWYAIFAPQAQGTIRVLSERLYFFSLASLFGIDALPFKILGFATFGVALIAWNSVVTRLTGSRLAGIVAAGFWAISPRTAIPLSWASGYNQILISALMTGAFACLLRALDSDRPRRWWIAQWALYLAGFLTLEIVIVYPALVLVYLWFTNRDQVRRAAWMLVPAALFTALHLFIIPKTPSPIYQMFFDLDLAKNLARYFFRALGPARLGTNVDPSLALTGVIIAGALAGAAALILLLDLRRPANRCGSRAPWFGLAWFLFFLAPVLPLKNHVSDYYLFLPVAGLALIFGALAQRAWHAGWLARIPALALLAATLWGSVVETRAITNWFVERERRMRNIITGISAFAEQRKLEAVFLSGIDKDLFYLGFAEQPFRLFGLHKVFLVPGQDSVLTERPDLRGVASYRTTPDFALAMLDTGRAAVIQVGNGEMEEATRRYRQVVEFRYRGELPRRVDVALPSFARSLGAGWYKPESGFRWIAQRAELKMAAPAAAGTKLLLNGYCHEQVVATAPLRLTVSANGVTLGTREITRGGQMFDLAFDLPPSLTGAKEMNLVLAVDRTTRFPGDGRDLGLIIGTLALEP
jgi:hypothetical protein